MDGTDDRVARGLDELVAVVQAQAALQDFYRSLGFAPISGEYLWDGIPHVDMERPPVR